MLSCLYEEWYFTILSLEWLNNIADSVFMLINDLSFGAASLLMLHNFEFYIVDTIVPWYFLIDFSMGKSCNGLWGKKTIFSRDFSNYSWIINDLVSEGAANYYYSVFCIYNFIKSSCINNSSVYLYNENPGYHLSS